MFHERSLFANAFEIKVAKLFADIQPPFGGVKIDLPTTIFDAGIPWIDINSATLVVKAQPLLVINKLAYVS